jgi:hypothetical protein
MPLRYVGIVLDPHALSTRCVSRPLPTYPSIANRQAAAHIMLNHEPPEHTPASRASVQIRRSDAGRPS